MSRPFSYYDATLALIGAAVSVSGLPTSAIAAGLGVSESALARKLSGDVTLTVREIGALADVLSCRMSALVA